MNPAAQFAALSDPTRWAVFQCIRGCGGSLYDPETGECFGSDARRAVSIKEACCTVACAPSTLSHHLSVLREAGLISTEMRGRQVYAWVEDATLQSLIRHLAETPVCAPAVSTRTSLPKGES